MKPFKRSKTYCNDGSSGPTNACCYHHDAGYSDPRGKTRKAIDGAFLDCMKRRGMPIKGAFMYSAIRIGGWISWLRCRAHDKTQIKE